MSLSSMLGISSELVILTAPGEAAALRPLLPDGVALFEFIAVENGQLRLRGHDGADLVLRAAPPLCIGLITTSQRGLDILDEGVKSFSALGAFHELIPTLIEPGAEPLGLLLATHLVRRLRAQSALTVRLAREQAALRATYEQVQNAFAKLENFVTSAGLQPVRLSFENDPDAAQFVGGPQVIEIRQLLPVSILGLCALELHVAEVGAQQGFVATLTTREDGEVYGRWEFGPSDIRPGWLALSLPKAILGLQRTPELILRALSEQTGMPMLSLGVPQPLSAFRAITKGAIAPVRSLALRAWLGLPGVRPPELVAPAPPKPPAGPRSFEVALPFSLVRRVKPVLIHWKPSFDVLEIKPDIRGFLCHPGPSGELTTAALDGLDLSEPSLFSAQATVISPSSAPVEFSIAFSNLPEEEVKALLQEGYLGAGGADFTCTGWRRVVHGRQARLSVTAMGATGRLYFSTRMADGAPEWFAWATFGDLRQVFLGKRDPPDPRVERVSTLALRGPTDDRAAAPTKSDLGVSAVEIPAPVRAPERSKLDAQLQNAVTSWLSTAPGIGFDPGSLGVACPPPNSGVALRRLPAIPIPASFEFSANLRVANTGSPAVEFGVAVTDLSAGDVLVRVSAKARRWSQDSRFAFSGWRSVEPGENGQIKLSAGGLATEEANVFLMTRLSGKARGAARASAFFERIAFNTWATQNEDA